MKKSKMFIIIFLSLTVLLLIANITLIIIFSFVHMNEDFYASLNVASLSISFFSLIASSFFSLSVYLQSKEQSKINEKLPRKDDQYIIANYSLFNIEKEFSVFTVNDDEKQNILMENKFLSNLNENIQDITRLVFLPTDSLNVPTYKVMLKSIKFYSSKNEELYYAFSINKIDAEYSSNILQREYNCICVDLAKDYDSLANILEKTKYLELNLDIISVFNVNMSVKFNIYIESLKNVDNNPDKKILKDLITYNIHHSNYNIENKSICSE